MKDQLNSKIMKSIGVNKKTNKRKAILPQRNQLSKSLDATANFKVEDRFKR